MGQETRTEDQFSEQTNSWTRFQEIKQKMSTTKMLLIIHHCTGNMCAGGKYGESVLFSTTKLKPKLY